LAGGQVERVVVPGAGTGLAWVTIRRGRVPVVGPLELAGTRVITGRWAIRARPVLAWPAGRGRRRGVLGVLVPRGGRDGAGIPAGRHRLLVRGRGAIPRAVAHGLVEPRPVERRRRMIRGQRRPVPGGQYRLVHRGPVGL